MKTKKYFNSFRWLAIAALVCTIVILIVMLVESAMPGDKSLTHSEKWTDSLQDYAGDRFEQAVGTEPVREVIVSALYGYAGTSKKAQFSCIPTDARPTEYVYTTGNPAIAEVDENGVITFKKTGKTSLKVSVKDDPSVFDTENIFCWGTHPDNITSALPPFTTVSEGQIRDGFYLKDQDGNYVSLYCFDVNQDTKCVRLEGEWLTGMSIGKSTVTFSPKGHPERQFTYEFETLPNPKLVRATAVELKTYEITINKFDVIDVTQYISKVIPSNATNFSFVGGIVNPEGVEVMSSVTGEQKRAEHVGTAKIVIGDNVSNQARAELIVHVVIPTPTKINVIGDSSAQLNYNYRYTAEGDYCQLDEVVWSVVSGKAEISQTGVLSKTHLGKVVIRAAFKDDPSVYADFTVDVKLYTSFSSFIRKTLGHFALFIVIGFGLAATFMFLIKPRLASVPVAVASGFAFSLLSEVLQLPIFTTGRLFAWSDVFVDFFGASVGVVAAYLLTVIILLCFRLSKRKNDLMTAFNTISAKTLFKKAPAFDAASSPADPQEKTDFDTNPAIVADSTSIATSQTAADIATDTTSGTSSDTTSGTAS